MPLQAKRWTLTNLQSAAIAGQAHMPPHRRRNVVQHRVLKHSGLAYLGNGVMGGARRNVRVARGRVEVRRQLVGDTRQRISRIKVGFYRLSPEFQLANLSVVQAVWSMNPIAPRSQAKEVGYVL